MLERSIRACQEPMQIFMHSTIRFVPYIIECWVVICGCTTIYNDIDEKRNYEQSLTKIPFDERLPRAAALFPWTSELGEFVRGMRTSQIPISKSWPFSSSSRVMNISSQQTPLGTNRLTLIQQRMLSFRSAHWLELLVRVLWLTAPPLPSRLPSCSFQNSQQDFAGLKWRGIAPLHCL